MKDDKQLDEASVPTDMRMSHIPFSDLPLHVPAQPKSTVPPPLPTRCLLPLGCYEGIPVSIISHLMGMSNMDFMVRECRAVVDGQMAIVRLGTCGVVQPPGKLGQLVLAWPGSITVR